MIFNTKKIWIIVLFKYRIDLKSLKIGGYYFSNRLQLFVLRRFRLFYKGLPTPDASFVRL